MIPTSAPVSIVVGLPAGAPMVWTRIFVWAVPGDRHTGYLLRETRVRPASTLVLICRYGLTRATVAGRTVRGTLTWDTTVMPVSHTHAHLVRTATITVEQIVEGVGCVASIMDLLPHSTMPPWVGAAWNRRY